MPACPRCGEANVERARFCSACGAPLGARGADEARKTVTVLFCDITNSTRIGESLDPESHRRVMRHWFEAMRSVLEYHGGTVEKFIGDAVMAVFGIPVLHEDDALRAVRAATEMREALARLNERLRGQWGLEIAIRIGLNTGEVVAGEPGQAETLVTGDPVVVAKRLEETAATGEIQIGEATYKLVKDVILAEPAGPVDAKGKPALPAWRLLAVLRGAEATPLRLDSPLVGRERDLRALQDSFERVTAEGACHLVTVLGPAGIGKSRLTHELIDWLRDRARILRGRCLPYGEGITFWPLVEVVKRAAGLTERDSPEQAREKIGALLPDDEQSALVCKGVAAAVGRGEAASARPEETFWAVRRLLEALSQDRPLVLVFDDVQWAESTFLDLVEYVAGWTTAPILLCCLARPDLLERRPSWGLPKPRATAIVLEPLPDPDTEELVGNLLGRLPLVGASKGRIATAAEGNPLFVEELVRALVDEGLLRRENGGWQAAGDLGRLTVPPTIHALLAARLDRLDPPERAVVQRASVAGQVFWWGAVSELTPASDRAAVGSSLHALVRSDLIRREPSEFADEDAFRFGHILVRDAAYAALPKDVRADLHERLADWLERKAEDRTAEYEEILGFHLEQAYRYRSEIVMADERARELGARAASHLAGAARRANALGDASAAVRLFERVAALLPAGDIDTLELAVDLVLSFLEAGEIPRAQAMIDDAYDVARTSAARRLEARAVAAQATLLFATERADAEAVIEGVERAIAVLEAERDDLGLARALHVIGQAHWLRCRCAAMEEVLERALVHAERAGGRRERSTILNGLARATLGPMPADKAIRRCEEIMVRAGGDRMLEAEVAPILATLHAMRGDFDRGRELCRRSKRTFEELGRKWSGAGIGMYSAYVELLAGDPAAAGRELRSGYDALARIGERAALSTVAAGLAIALQFERRDSEAWEFSLIAERAASRDDMVTQVLWRSARERLLSRRGRLDRAEELAGEAVALADTTDFLDLQGVARLDLAFVYRSTHRPGEARAEAERALACFQRKGNLVSAERVRGLLAELAEPVGLTRAPRSDT